MAARCEEGDPGATGRRRVRVTVCFKQHKNEDDPFYRPQLLHERVQPMGGHRAGFEVGLYREYVQHAGSPVVPASRPQRSSRWSTSGLRPAAQGNGDEDWGTGNTEPGSRQGKVLQRLLDYRGRFWHE